MVNDMIHQAVRLWVVGIITLIMLSPKAEAGSCADGPVWDQGTGYFATIQAAVTSVSDEKTILMAATSALGSHWHEDVVLNGPGTTVKLSGGYSCDFSELNGFSDISGTLTVSSGTLIVSGITLTQVSRSLMAVASVTPNTGVGIRMSRNGGMFVPLETPVQRYGTTGDTISLVAPATAPNGNLFVSWSGCDSTADAGRTCVLTLSMDRAIQVVYAPPVLQIPTITAINPATGPTSTLVTLTGSGFGGVSAVLFNGSPATYTVMGDNQITATVPTGSVSGRFTVVSSGGSADSPVFSVTIPPPVFWEPRGIGAGGALFSPSINPVNPFDYYVSCDMSEIFHTTDFGDSYSVLDSRQIQGGHYSAVRFTSDPAIRYSLSYANGNNAVLVKSSDGGGTWSTLGADPLLYDNKYGIWADPNRTDRVLVSGWSDLYCSTDGGSSFHLAYGGSSSNGLKVGGAFFDGDNIYLGTSAGMLVSHDGGVTFSLGATPGIPATEAISSFVGAKQNGTIRFYALTGAIGRVYPLDASGGDYWGFVKGIYRLDEPNGTWAKRMNGISPDTDFVQYLAMAHNDISTVYAGGGSAGNVPVVFATSDGGNTWRNIFITDDNANISTGWSGTGGDRQWSFGEVVYGIAVAPHDATKVVITDMGFVHRTDDGGRSWRQAYVSTNDQHPAGMTAIANDTYHSIGLENTSSWQLIWANQNTLFGAFSDIRGIRSTDGGVSWSFNYSGLMANTTYRIVQDPVTNYLYGATSDIHDMYQSTRLAANNLDQTDPHGDILMSVDQGSTWSLVHSFGHPVFWLAQDPNRRSRMYASVIHSTQGGLYMTENLSSGANATWTKIPNPSRAIGHPASITVLNDGTVVCSFSGERTASGFTATSGVFVYDPVTKRWQDRSDPGMYYWTKDVVIDPADSSQNTWFVGVFSGWGGSSNNLGGLYRTTDRGAHWTRVVALERVTSVTINPAHPDNAYLTTEGEGLWHTDTLHDVVPRFSRVASYHFRQPERVFFNPFNSHEVWVTSFGNGLSVGILP